MRTTKTTSIAEKKSTKDKIREIIKKPKEKFLTSSQEEYWEILGKNQITLCFGPSGVGKSFLTLKKAVDLIYEEDNKYEKIIILRPLVTSGKDPLGSLPGTLSEKLDPYVYPSFYLLDKIIGLKSREILIENNILEILALCYCRGLNFDNSIVAVEESQNITPEEMKLILTRIGFNTKIFISGDLEQSDKFKDIKKSGLYDAKERLKDLKDIGVFEFGLNDIIRNPLISQILERYNI